MLHAVALLLAAALLAGCGTTSLRIPETAPSQVTVRWVRVPRQQVAFWCHKANARLGSLPMPLNAAACAHVDLPAKECTIYTADDFSMDVLGHELTHCFAGAWHH